MTSPADTIREALNGLAGQQAMPDDSWRVALAALTELEQELAALEARWQEMEHPFDKSEYDAMFERMKAAEADAAKAWDFEHKMMERATEAEEKLEAAEADHHRLQEELSRYQGIAAEAEADRDRLDKIVDEKIESVGKLVMREQRLTTKLEDADREIDLLTADRDRLADTLRELEQAVSDITSTLAYYIGPNARTAVSRTSIELYMRVVAAHNAARAALDRHTKADT